MRESIFKEEEKALLVSVDKARLSSNNAQVIGRNGELPLINFLNNYLPPTLRAVSGHFVTVNEYKSPQIDIIIIDTRYPLLGYNSDGTVIVMAHAVLRIIEIKTNLTTKDIHKTESNFLNMREHTHKIWEGDIYDFRNPIYELIAYRISVKESTIMNTYFKVCNPIINHFQITILRPEKDNNSGTELFFQPTSYWEDFTEESYEKNKEEMKGEYIFCASEIEIPLSNFYYSIIQDSYYLLGERNYSFTEIGQHFNDYINWT